MYYANTAFKAVTARKFMNRYPVSSARHQAFACLMQKALAELKLGYDTITIGVVYSVPSAILRQAHAELSALRQAYAEFSIRT